MAAAQLLDDVGFAELLVPIDTTTDPAFRALLAEAGRRSVRITIASQGDRLQGLGDEVSVLSPSWRNRSFYMTGLLELARIPLVIRVGRLGQGILLAGSVTDDWSLGGTDLKSAVMLAAQEGSLKANSDRLLARVAPSLLVVGSRNRARPELVRRAERHRIAVHSLRLDGALICTFSGDSLSVAAPFRSAAPETAVSEPGPTAL